MKTTILGGVLFLAPLAIVAIIVGKAFQISLLVAEPLSTVVPLDTVLGVLAVNVIAVILLVLFCYVAGLLAQRAYLFSSRIQRLEGFLIDLIPGYAIFRNIVQSASSEDELASRMKPVLARFDDYDQIAFEIEKHEDYSVLFLPGTPSAWSGSSAIVSADRITRLNVPTHQAVKLMRTFGRGSLDVRAQALSSAQRTPEK